MGQTGVVISSMVASSSADISQEAATALAWTCPGLVAPEMTEPTAGWLASQLMASSNRVWPAASATTRRFSTLSTLAAERKRDAGGCRRRAERLRGRPRL